MGAVITPKVVDVRAVTQSGHQNADLAIQMLLLINQPLVEMSGVASLLAERLPAPRRRHVRSVGVLSDESGWRPTEREARAWSAPDPLIDAGAAGIRAVGAP